MIMLISCSCIVIASRILSWHSISAFKFNRIKLNLNNCWLSHGATISNWPVQPCLPLCEGPNWVYCHASRRCLQRGKVMVAHYPDQVGGHKPCVPVLIVMVPCPHLGPFMFSMTVAVGVFGRHGATHGLAQRGVGRSGWESVMAVGWFCRNVIGPPEWECEAMGSVVWVQCANICRVCV